MMHEIGHALGLLHEHSRWDREDWIRVDAEVVQEVLGDYDVQWWTDIDADADETSYGLEYDTRSIMHYRSCLSHSNTLISELLLIPV